MISAWKKDREHRRSVMVVLGCCLVALAWATETRAAETSAVTVEVHGNTQTLDAEVGAAPLAEILQVVADKAGFGLEVRGALGEVRAQAFEGVLLEEGIRRLVGDNPVNLVMTYEVGEDGRRRLVGVRAHAAREVSTEAMEELRMRLSIRREEPPPLPPPPAGSLTAD